MPAYPDSMKKILETYVRAVATKEFTVDGRTLVPPDELWLSSSFFRGFECVDKCGGCCPHFTLDYFHGARRTLEMIDTVSGERLENRRIEVNGRPFWYLSDQQKDHKDPHCRNLNKIDGRCGIYPVRPLSCSFEPTIKFINYGLCQIGVSRVVVTKRPFGRAWQMLRIDDGRGAMCEWPEEADLDAVEHRDVPLFVELMKLCQQLEVQTHLFALTTHIRGALVVIREGYSLKEYWGGKETFLVASN
jgi:Fe-S-cluster containining protein